MVHDKGKRLKLQFESRQITLKWESGFLGTNCLNGQADWDMNGKAYTDLPQMKAPQLMKNIFRL